MSITLSIRWSPSTLWCRPWSVLARCSFCASERNKMSFTSVDLPEPETPVTTTRQPSGKETSMSRRLCSRAPRTTTRPFPVPPFGRDGDPRSPPQITPGDGVLGTDEALHGPGVDDLPAVLARARADVDDVVDDDDLLVVLDDDHRIAEVAQPRVSLDESGVVARVQADGRLVEDVEHPDEAAADLAREADALSLAARQRGRRAGPA